jgi:hypothetical protein
MYAAFCILVTQLLAEDVPGLDRVDAADFAKLDRLLETDIPALRRDAQPVFHK